jgi:rod shape-determining protein MreC
MIEFLRRNQVVLGSGFFLFLSLILVSSSTRSPGRADPLGRLALEAMYPLQIAVTGVADGTRTLWDDYVNLIGLREEHAQLEARVHALEGDLVRMAELEAANGRLRRLLKFQRTVPAPMVTAQVIGWDASGRYRTLTIDKGESDGVVRGAAVLAPEGVVGRVYLASRNAARVLLISDHNSGVDAIVQRTRTGGIVEGHDDGCALKYVKRAEDVQLGDAVVTSGLDGIFPKGLLIGEIARVDKRGRGLFQEIEVAPRVNFGQLEEVLVTTGRAAGGDTVVPEPRG